MPNAQSSWFAIPGKGALNTESLDWALDGNPFWLTLHFEGRSYEASVDSLTFSAVTGESLHHPFALTCFVISWPPDKGAWGSIPLCPLRSS